MTPTSGSGRLDDWFLTVTERGNPASVLDHRHPVAPSAGERSPGAAWTEGNEVRVLIDGHEYFTTLLEALGRAGPGDWIYVTDLEGHADEQLDRETGADVGTVLAGRAEAGAQVRGLLWRSHPVVLSQGDNLLLSRRVNAAGGEVLLDNRIRRGGSHHQKIVVIRPGAPGESASGCPEVAFVGGIDLAHGRHDDGAHHGDPQAATLDDSHYGERPPWHDLQVRIQGPAVDDVAYTFRERWEDPTPLDSRTPWRLALHRAAIHPPERGPLAPDRRPEPCGPHAVQILRTYPARRRQYPFAPRGERSIARAYVKALARARCLVYLEDQYLWSLHAVRPIVRALRREPGLHVVAVIPRYPDPGGRLLGAAGAFGRELVLGALYAAGGDRVAVYDLENDEGTPVYVHSKVCIVDDVWMAVGSDNLNRRSWTHDSEISCAVLDSTLDEREPRDPAGRGDGARVLARQTRLRLGAEHLGRAIGVGDEARELVDPASWFRALATSAADLDAWHQAGATGARPPGHLRRHPTERLHSQRLRPLLRHLHRTVLDPDGRPPELRVLRRL